MRARHTTPPAALLAAVLLTACSTGDGKPLDEAAAVMCEDFVKQRLKSPGSAEFPDTLDADYAKTKVLSDTKPWKYKVTGVVDSENSLGAKVRSDYVCTVSTKDDDTWTLDDMQMNQR
ncbi:hypothetical protein [Streptomyces scabiei]|uniref:hypothetical protein n=1 Tax=Streptomyces scabiei TaxID=1930 RepID=UPI000765E702|nr:hypothetical protein [Streptomyces scabiei]